MRDSYKRLLRSNGKKPHSWLQQVLRCFNPCWLSFIMDDWQSWSQVIVDIGEHASSSTVLYAMWSRSDLYIGKANTQRFKHGKHYAGAPHRLIEHWEGLCLPKSQCYHRPRYKLFRRHAWSDIRFMPIFIVDNMAHGRLIESFVIRTMSPSANLRDNVRQSRSLKFKPAKRRRPPSGIRKKEKRHGLSNLFGLLNFDPMLQTM